MTTRTLLPIRRVAEKIGRSKSWIRAQLAMKDGARIISGSDFPEPLELDGYTRSVWDAAEIDGWIEKHIRTAKEKKAQRSAGRVEARV